MLFRRRKDILSPISQPTGTAAQTLTFRIKQEQRRLDGVILAIDFTPNAAAATGATWGGYGGVVREIRIKVQDVIGSRNIVQVSGVGCLGFVKQNLGQLDRQTQGVYGASALPSVAAQATVTTFWYVPIRHPIISEPFGNYLSLPLSSRYLGDDVIVEVDLHDIVAGGTVFTATPPTFSATGCQLQTLVREVPEEWGYIPSELRTDNFIPSGIANAAYEFTSNGYLTQALIQGFSAAALGNAVTRASLLAAGGNLRFEYGREIWLKDNDGFNNCLNDLGVQTYPQNVLANIANSHLMNRNFQGEYFFDFLSDLPNTSAFSVGSVPNLYTSALGGDKARLVFNDHGGVLRLGHITMHRLLPAKADDLKALASAI